MPCLVIYYLILCLCTDGRAGPQFRRVFIILQCDDNKDYLSIYLSKKNNMAVECVVDSWLTASPGPSQTDWTDWAG